MDVTVIWTPSQATGGLAFGPPERVSSHDGDDHDLPRRESA